MRLRQRGQALPLGLALTVFGILGGFVLYNTGRTATDKARLVNAADSAAYSGVLWQARALNFQAYTNRAMVANQVSMAQAVSLNSWMNHAVIASNNVSTVLSPVPIIGGIAAGVDAVVTGLDQVVTPISRGMLVTVDTINKGVAAVQEGMFLSTFAATPEIVRAVATASDERFTADTAYSAMGVLGNLEDWSSFTSQVDVDDEPRMQQRADLIMESRDDFTAGRNWRLFDRYLFVAPAWRVALDREGDTRLVRGANGEWEWKAKDTMSLHNKVGFGFMSAKFEVPFGWAESFANNAGSDSSVEQVHCRERSGILSFLPDECDTWFGRNRKAELYATNAIPGVTGRPSKTSLTGYNGLNPFRNLSDERIAEDFPTLKLRVEVAMPANRVRTTDAMGTQGEFSTPMTAPGDLLSSISIAEVYFKPPDAEAEVGGKVAGIEKLEFANAYSPFWDVRLSPVSQTERLAALAMRGDTGTVTPAGSTVPGSRSTDLGATVTVGEGGGLGTYAALGDVLGADAGAAGERVTAFAGGSADLMGAVQSRFGSEVADAEGVAGIVERQLTNALTDALDSMLRGMVADATGIRGPDDLTALIDARTGGLASRAIEYRDDGLEIIDDLEGAQDELERITDAITDDFEMVFLEAFERYGMTESALSDILDHDTSVLGPDGLPLPAPTSEQLVAAREELARLENDFVDEVADELVRLVNEVQDDWVPTVDVARIQVRMWLDQLREEAAGGPDMTPFGVPVPVDTPGFDNLFEE